MHCSLWNEIMPKWFHRIRFSACVHQNFYRLALMNTTISPYLSDVLGAIIECTGYLSANFVMRSGLGRVYILSLYALSTPACALINPSVSGHHPIATIILSQLSKITVSDALSIFRV